MKQKRKICGVGFLLALSMLCSSQAQATAIQDRMDRTGQKIQELEDALDQTDQKISTYQKEQNILEQEIAVKQEKISRLSEELDDTRSSIADTQEEIQKTQQSLQQSKADSKEQYEQMKQRIRFMYENSTTDMIMCVLEADSMPEALRRANYFMAVMSYDREKLEEYKETTRKIKKDKAKLVAEKEQLEILEKQQSGQLSEIDETVVQLKYHLSSKIAQIQDSKELQEKYEQDLERQKQYEKELERQKAEEDKKREEEIRQQEEQLRRQQEEQQRQPNSSSGSSGRNADSGNAGRSVQAGAGDLELLSTIIYCEAGNQSYEGQLAVGSVILNRVASSSFPNSISGVIYQSGQFSPVASGRFAHALAAGLGNRCVSAAREVLNGRRNVDCLYFRADNGLIDGLVIGDHVFY
ncbi:MAG: cell wall hydrolase [Eubacterium sp.]|nr:cell wall hydrolase [Eubacterium sp.]